MMRHTGLHVVLLVLAVAGCDRVFNLTAPIDAAPIPPPPSSWRMVDAGTAYACGLHHDNTLWCWGRNDEGQLGLGTRDIDAERREPTQVGTEEWSQISANDATTCGIKLDGSLWCWGRNSTGQVGDGTEEQRNLPTRVGPSSTWKDVAAGWYHTCAIDSADALWCWGAGREGQRGDGTMTEVMVPTRVVGSTSWNKVGVGENFTCALATDGGLWCWGLNDDGRLGLGTGTPQWQFSPMHVGTGSWTALSVGAKSSCAIAAPGSVRCWGTNVDGQLGDGTTTARAEPTPLGDDELTDYTAVVVGGFHACALRASGEVRCWGKNHRGQLGVELAIPQRPIPTVLDAVDGVVAPWTALGLGPRTTCAIDSTGQLFCVGEAGNGALGVPDGGSRRKPVMIGGSWDALSLGEDATCAKLGTTMTCWGSNVGGLLGDGTEIDKFAPSMPSPQVWNAVDLGDHGCAIGAGSLLYCWGRNDYGQLGTNNTTWTTTPVLVGSSQSSRISSSRSHNCAISAGSMYCWGRNAEFQTGQTSTAPTIIPRVVETGSMWSEVGTGIDFSCGLKQDSKPYCWGHSGTGQLGNNAATGPTATPQPVMTALTFAKIFVGGRHACAVTTAGIAWCWGWNVYGQLGIGSSDNRVVPAQLNGTWKSLALGEEHSCGVRTDNTLWCWGRNHFAQLGDDSTIDRIDQTRIGSEIDWDTVAAGTRHTCATKLSTGVLWCWGTNERGATGDGTAWRSTLTLVTK